MHIRDKLPHYRAFLLRFWREGDQTSSTTRTWRFSLEDPHTGERHAFSGLERLLAFLREQTNLVDPPDDKTAAHSDQ